MTTEVKEKNNATLAGKLKPSQKEFIDHGITGPNGEKLEFNEKMAELIDAYKEKKRKTQENKVQITSKLERINQYNAQINEIIKSIATDSEQLVELNNQEIKDEIDKLKQIDEVNQKLVEENAETTKVNEKLTKENSELEEKITALEEGSEALQNIVSEKDDELISLKADFNKSSEKINDLIEEKTRLVNAHITAIDTKNTEINNLTVAVEDHKRDIAKKDNEIANLQQSLNHKEEQLGELNKNIEKAESDKVFLQEQLKELQEQVKQLRLDINAKDKVIKNKDITITNKDTQINDKVDENKTLVETVNKKDNKIKDLNQNIKDLQAEHEKKLEATTKKFEAKIEEDADRHSKELALIQQENARINTELMELQESVEKDYVKVEDYNKVSKSYKELVEQHNHVIAELRKKKIIDEKGNFIAEKSTNK